MPCPSLPYKLSPLSGPSRAKTACNNTSTLFDSDSDSGDTDLEDSELEQEEDEDEELEELAAADTLSSFVAEAAVDAAREAVLADADDELAVEAEDLDCHDRTV